MNYNVKTENSQLTGHIYHKLDRLGIHFLSLHFSKIAIKYKNCSLPANCCRHNSSNRFQTRHFHVQYSQHLILNLITAFNYKYYSEWPSCNDMVFDIIG